MFQRPRRIEWEDLTSTFGRMTRYTIETARIYGKQDKHYSTWKHYADLLVEADAIDTAQKLVRSGRDRNRRVAVRVIEVTTKITWEGE